MVTVHFDGASPNLTLEPLLNAVQVLFEFLVFVS